MQSPVQMIKRWLPQGKRKSRLPIGVFVTPSRAWAVRARRRGGRLTVEACATEPVTPDRLVEAVSQLIKTVAPRSAEVSVALSPAFYSLLLVDAPAVPAEEMREAARWRVKDLVNIPLDSLVIDVFSLPPDAYRGRLEMIYVAATDRGCVSSLARLDKKPLKLNAITVQELALINAFREVSEMQTGGTALLLLDAEGGAILLVDGDHLYLSRSLDVSARGSASLMEEGELALRVERLGLDVQRSLDYYESQIGKSAPSRVAWLAGDADADVMARGLSSALTVNVQPFTLDHLAQWPESLDTTSLYGWATALGAALMAENPDAAD